MFRRRRQRREFQQLIAAEVERVGPLVREATDEVEADVEETAALLRTMPGADATCPQCGGRMWMQRVKQRRRWWTLWVCSVCGQTVRPADLRPVPSTEGSPR